MADHHNSLSQIHFTKSVSSFSGSPRFFNGFLTRSLSDTETMSPVSILDTKPFSNSSSNPSFGTIFSTLSVKLPKNSPVNKQSWEEFGTRGIGLVLDDLIADEKNSENISSPKSSSTGKILFGSKLKIQIPLLAVSPSQSPKSPADFGIKSNRDFSMSPLSVNSPKTLSRYPSFSEMELSEDYTCVITHGPNPRTTHIFDNCIVESCPNVVGSKRDQQCCLNRGEKGSCSCQDTIFDDENVEFGSSF
ncbi:FCS-Like Zinc finger 8-like [Impatiens glandulifera]|uniref:FCS-Like Zinc finger 8-like n=1 Tax=Impatiens glandulifera TaxID=253017 RepID=UPI001FB0E236|nr:FCS-Like Zinc finger 8-like [Impatiens glandulifera]